jgi:nicotinate-nucleotide adenylyltransferase
MNIGILGGTFDPVHRAHIMLTEEARTRLDLAEVIFVPTAHTPLKQDSDITPVGHRVRMLELAIEDYDYFRLSTIEIDRAGTSYTVDTLSDMKDELGAGHELYFIIGLDSLETLPKWKEPGRLIRMCRLVTVARPGHSLPELSTLEKQVPGISERLILLEKPLIDISATEIRNRVARGLPIDHLVPVPVEKYIKEHGLYKE